MKKKTWIAYTAVFAGGIYTYIETKKAQERARREKRHVPYGPYEAVWKRKLDVVLGGTALAAVSPFMAAIGLLVRAKLGRPILFRQERPGKDGKIFRIIKFRTMTEERGADGELLPDEERLTGFGKWLRSTSLDELPELINIICGDMSIVGPRPLLAEYLSRYDERQKHRQDVRAGLTGLAQVSGRNCLTWEEKFEEDLAYVAKITFWGDMKILFHTARVVLQKTGVSPKTGETMEAFTGNK